MPPEWPWGWAVLRRRKETNRSIGKSVYLRIHPFTEIVSLNLVKHNCISHCSQRHRPIGPTYIKIYYKEIYYKVLTHTVMESEKPHNLPAKTQEGWRCHTKAYELDCQGCVFQPGSEGLRTRGEKRQKINVPAQEIGQRVNSNPLYLFVLFRPSTGWVMPTCIGKDHLLYSTHQMLISSRSTLTDMP